MWERQQIAEPGTAVVRPACSTAGVLLTPRCSPSQGAPRRRQRGAGGGSGSGSRGCAEALVATAARGAQKCWDAACWIIDCLYLLLLLSVSQGM